MAEVGIGLALAAFALSAPELYRQGSSLFEAGRFLEAAARFEEARALAPKDARIWKALGVSYAALADYERANEPLRQACQLDPSLEDACYFYGRNLYALNRFEPALAALNKAFKATRHPWQVHLGIAQSYEGLADAPKAEPSFRKAVALFEDLAVHARGRPDFDPRIHYATFLYRQGRLPEALPFARKAVGDWPEYGRAHFELGRILHQQGELEQAALSLERAVQFRAGPPAHLLLGQVYLRLGRSAEAREHLTLGAQPAPVP